ncbi:MAG TPA: antibiotic biosynthesis monooxygenase [Trichocoleus sp.]
MQSSSHQQSDPVTLVISEVIESNRIEEYEAWTKGINQDARRFEGFLGVEVIRPRDHVYPEYVVILKFDTYAHLRNWLASPTYRAWMDKSYGLIAARTQQQLPSGIEMWFTLPTTRLSKISQPVYEQPAYYKKVVLGVLAVYPLILLANATIGPLLKGLPSLLGLLISVTFVSALLTYPVMPWLSNLLGFWLYPSAKARG